MGDADVDELTDKWLRNRQICFLVEDTGEGTNIVRLTEAVEEAESSGVASAWWMGIEVNKDVGD